MDEPGIVLYVDQTGNCRVTLSEWAETHGYAVVGIEEFWGATVSLAVGLGVPVLCRTAWDMPWASVASALQTLEKAGVHLITIDDGELAPDAAERWITTRSWRTPTESDSEC